MKIFNKKFLLIAVFLVGLLAISTVSANELNATDEDLSSNDENIINVSSDDVFGEDAGDTLNEEDCNTLKSDAESELGAGGIIYFDESADIDGDGSKENPYKYLNSNRIEPGCTAYFADGEYDLEDTCFFAGVELIGASKSAIINCNVANQHDFIINENSFGELNTLTLKNANILNHGTLIIENVDFYGNDLIDDDLGGVILCDGPNNSEPTLILNKCRFEGNQAYEGGVIGAVNSYININDCNIRIFHSTYKGGAICCFNSKLYISKSMFLPFAYSNLEQMRFNYDDNSYYGGSIYCENSECWITDCEFQKSTSYSFGGSIALLNSITTIHDTSFTYSSSLTDGGGAIYNINGDLNIRDSSFTHNSAEFGGAICNLNSILNLGPCYFYNNSAIYGGALYDMYGSLNIFENTFQYSYASIGGTIYTRIPNSFNFMDNTVSFSFAQEGSRIFFDGKSKNIFSSVFLDTFGNYFEDYSNDLMIPYDSSGLAMSNIYYDNYRVYAEFNAILNGEEYSLKSNPLSYCTAVKNTYVFKDIYSSYTPYVVSDDLVSLMIYDSNNLTNSYINTGYVTHNISASINFNNNNFTNPFLHFYLYDWYNNFIQKYSVDLSNKSTNGNQNFIENCSINFGSTFLTTKYDNLYEASSFNSVSLLDYTYSSFDTLPSRYDSRDYGFVSSIKDQLDGGNCWAFAGLATLETCLKKATGVSFDFSEENAKNLMAAYSVFGLKLETNTGGYESMLMSYLTSWLGPIDESIEKYDDYSSISIQGSPMFHIQNIKFLPARLNSFDNDLYKMAIRDNGAVSVSFKWDEEYHAVSLVGWDDNFKGKDSLGNDANGAWIFKNSWGEDWENNGFGYLSYEQKISEQISPNMHAYTFIFNDTNPYTKIYQYDFAGVSEFYHYDSIYFKNKFIAENDSLLSAFSTYFDAQTNFTVTVHVNDYLIYSQNGTAFAGYYTIPFDKFIQLNKGDEFSITVHNHNVGKNCIPVCSAEEITKKTFNSNVSFISLDGENWFDLYDFEDSCNVACIKAFTRELNLTNIRINLNEFNVVNTNNFNIKTCFSEFEGIDSVDYCLVKFIIDGNVYYAQIKNGQASLNVNLEEGQHTLSAQYKDNVFESNIVKFNFTVIYDDSKQSFNALQDLINKAEHHSNITLNKDYFYDEQFDDEKYGVNINKTIRINGNGHVINGLSQATGFYVSANNVVLENIVFNNTLSSNGGAVYIAAHNVTLNNCSFINSRATQNGGGICSLFDISINNCRFINDSANAGGGLYLISTVSSTIENSCFDNNFVYDGGSAAYIEGIGHCVITSANFTNNVAKYNGGAVLSAVYYTNLTNCLFSNNSALYGGSVLSNSHSIEFNKCKFLKNLARDYGGAIMAYNIINIIDSEFIENSFLETNYNIYGGAIYSKDMLKIYNSNFTYNSAYSGGAVYNAKVVKDSMFINNSAYSGGAVYNAKVVKDSMFINNSAKVHGGALYASDSVKNCVFINNHVERDVYSIYSSDYAYGGAICDANLVEMCTFINNYGELHPVSNNTATYTYGGAIYSAKIVKDSTFINNSATYGGATYLNGEKTNIINSTFINNSAHAGGATYLYRGSDNIINSTFINNSAYLGGTAYLYLGNKNIANSTFIKNYADFGGVIFLDDANTSVNISSCNFKNNNATVSGGVIYSGHNGTSIIRTSDFMNNTAYYGGAILSIQNGTSIIQTSNFTNNTAHYGGAIYSDGKCVISDSEFSDNFATDWGSTIDAWAYLDLRNSHIKSNLGDIQVTFAYHYDNNNTIVYGDLFLKNNKIDTEGIGIYYNENEIQYKLPLYLVFNNITAVNGENVTICHFEDEDGNLFVTGEIGDLDVTLTNQYGDTINLCSKYYREMHGYCLNTSSIDCGNYKLNGTLPNNPLVSNYRVKQGILSIPDDSGRTIPVLTSSDLTKVYGTNDELIIALNDCFGNPIANNFINVDLNGDTTKIKTDSNGLARLAINLNPDTYTATISFAGSDKYSNMSTTVKITIENAYPGTVESDEHSSAPASEKIIIKKSNPKITAKKKTFKQKTKTKKYTIFLKNNLKKALKNTKVTLKINGKIYSAKTNSKGKATFKIKKLTKKGTYTAVITFAGDKYYNKATKKVKIKVK